MDKIIKIRKRINMGESILAIIDEIQALVDQAFKGEKRRRSKALEVSQLRALMWILSRPTYPVRLKDLRRDLGLADAVADRAVWSLGDGNTVVIRGEPIASPGLQLIEIDPDPADLRARLIKLTPTGQLLRKSLVSDYA